MMRRPVRRSGFTLVEVVVAMALLSAMAMALASTLWSAQRALAASERWMQAVQLATEGVERLRAGHPLGEVHADGRFVRSGSVRPWAGHPGVNLVEVTVTWNDGESRSFRLVTLVHH